MASLAIGCPYDGTQTLYVFVPSTTQPAGPSPAELAATASQEAVGKLVMPSLAVKVGPRAEQLAVNFPVWIYLNPEQVAVEPVTITAGTVSVTARAQLQSISVSPGEWAIKDQGAAGGFVPAFECSTLYAAPPTDWSAGDQPPCGYTYRYQSLKERTNGSGAWSMTVAAHWRVTWTSTGAAGAGGVIDPPPAVTTWQMAVGEFGTSGGYVQGGS